MIFFYNSLFRNKYCCQLLVFQFNLFKKIILILLVIFLFPNLGLSQLKLEALILPVYFSGIKDKNVKIIINQHVVTELSQYFELRSQ